ncbi:hypothetical protein R3P38DRAFT_2772704 [Favolaschia claudopus]|uniref:Uncharacterized protein n=1 Tax=Favolaschia claudopus TaxID=2862362 RepID=A0AAW0C3N8_9AGAR
MASSEQVPEKGAKFARVRRIRNMLSYMELLQDAIQLYTQTTIDYLRFKLQLIYPMGRDPDHGVRSTARRTLLNIIEVSDDSKTLEALTKNVPLSKDIVQQTLHQLAISSGEESDALTGLTSALMRLSGSTKGAWAISATNFIKYAPKLLDNHHLCLHASAILSNMALHEVLVLDTELETRLQDLASHPESEIREYALYALLG